MSARFIVSTPAFFQIDGGSRVVPVYEIESTIIPKVEIDLGSQYGRGKRFIIEAERDAEKETADHLLYTS